MLLLQKLEDKKLFSNNEKVVTKYLLDHKEKIRTLSMTTISKDTYTSASTAVRLAKKSGYPG